jgi:hypothetical protein
MPRQRLACLLLTFILCTSVFAQPLAKADSASDPLIAEMMALVKPETLYAYTGDLSGEWPVYVNGGPYRITTRATASGLPLQNAAQYVYEHLESLGLAVSYHNWAKNGYTGRNVIGELTGAARPDEVIYSPLTWTTTPPLAWPQARTTTPAARPGCCWQPISSAGIVLTAACVLFFLPAKNKGCTAAASTLSRLPLQEKTSRL